MAGSSDDACARPGADCPPSVRRAASGTTPVACVTIWPRKSVAGLRSQSRRDSLVKPRAPSPVSASPSGFFAAALALRISSSSGSDTTRQRQHEAEVVEVGHHRGLAVDQRVDDAQARPAWPGRRRPAATGSARLPGVMSDASSACARAVPEVSIACTMEMPTLEPMLRSRLKIGVPSLRRSGRERGEGHRAERHEGEADAQALDHARDDDDAAAHVQRHAGHHVQRDRGEREARAP